MGHRYQGIVADTIVAGKLGGRHAIWRPLGRRLGRHAGLDVIVPVPTEPRRRRQRGFDHTQLLGAGLADVTGLPLLPAIAARRGAADRGRVNASDDAAETVDGVPWLVTSSLRGAHVVIVDDVITTGTTLVGVAAACREAGAVRVVAAVVSAAPGHAT